VCFDPQKLLSSADDSNGGSVVAESAAAATAPSPVRKPTARKSTTGRRMMQVALFRSAKFHGQQRGNAGTSAEAVGVNDDTDSNSDDGNLKIVEDDEEIEATDDDDGDGNKDVDEEIEIDDSMGDDSEVVSHSSAVYIDCDMDESDATYVHSSFLRYCCHVCAFTVLSSSPSALAEHLNHEHHSDMCHLPAVEILDFDIDIDIDGTTPMLLRRCGFCSFESYVGNEFDDHVLSAHGLPRPLRCNLGCMYATFSRLQMHAHFAETHPREIFSISPLDKPYSMLPYEDAAEDSDDLFVTFSAKVALDDVFEWSDSRFEALLNEHGVWY